MSKNLDIVFLMDFYESMLTDNQREMLKCYYSDDLSLGEISEIYGITRQGVRDTIKRAEALLISYEEKLGAAHKFKEIKKQAKQLIALATEINEYNKRYGCSGEIRERAEKIAEISKNITY